ncbi:MAG: L,D-transpeptidase [Methylococcales bacterium]|nr:L,D-transpeptidase [Methylococcales bacterium]
MSRIYILLLLSWISSAAFAGEKIWLLADTKALSLSVNQGNKTLEVFDNIAIGKRGAGFKRRVGDEITPLGEYRIGSIDTRSAFHVFMGITYPSEKNAKQALQQGLINQNHYAAIADADDWGSTPPQNTPIGGRIGIHGLGRADPKIHESMNWTRGCIALTNAQIDRLRHWVTAGMVIKIK